MISIELNEINFSWVKYYIEQGKLKNFKELFERHVVYQTSSENEYSQLEPWIQWPSFYSGKSFSDHKCFHIGDFKKYNLESIFSEIQNDGKSVLAVSPMNCYFEEENSSIFLPDPWEDFETKDKGFLSILYRAIRDKVNTNATSNSKLSSYFVLALGLIRYARPKNYFKYIRFIFLSFQYKWYQAITLDLLLFDIFSRQHKKYKFAYSSIFLNAGAHIQHHYLFDSKCYRGDSRNPDGYSKASNTDADPIFEILNLYDDIVGEVLSQNLKFMISTGLQQTENRKPYCQYRFKDHEKSLFKLGISFDSLTARMSRDFTLFFSTKDNLLKNQKILQDCMINNKNLFDIDVDIKSKSIFVKIAWTDCIEEFKNVSLNKIKYDLLQDISLVSVENSIHIANGWHVRNFDENKNEGITQIWALKDTILKNI